MGPGSELRPKPMVEVGGRPLLWHIMSFYAGWGCHRFVLCLGHRGDVIRSWFQLGRHHDADLVVGPGETVRFLPRGGHGGVPPERWSVTLVETGQDTPTAGRLVAAGPHIDRDRPWMMTYGDGVADVDLEGLLAHHRRMGVLATVTAMRPRSRFGILDIHDGRVTRFEEKAQLQEWVSGGFFVFEPEVLERLPADEPLEGRPLAEMARQGELAAWRHTGFWLSVDTPRDLAALQQLWREGVRPWLR